MSYSCSFSCFSEVLVIFFFCAPFIFFQIVINLLSSTSVCILLLVTRVSAVIVVAVRPLSTFPISSPLFKFFSTVFGKSGVLFHNCNF